MKIISSIMDEFSLVPNQYHAICFESTTSQQHFRKLLSDYFSNKKRQETKYIHLVDNSYNNISHKDFYFIHFDCNKVVLSEEKDTKEIIQNALFHLLEANPYYIEALTDMNRQLESFFLSLHMNHNQLSIEFNQSKRTIQNLIKSLDISIDYEVDGNVPNYVLRDFLIKLLLELNIQQKEVVLFLTYPESEVGVKSFNHVTQLLKKLNVTTLVLTAQEHFLIEADTDCMFLVKTCGNIYNIKKLESELEAFRIFHTNALAEATKKTAFLDFKKDYTLLNDQVRNFLISNKM